MSVNRYAPAAEYLPETGEYVGSMDELPDGQYVAFADYDALRRKLAGARADKDAWMHEFHATIAEQQAQLAEARELLATSHTDGLHWKTWRTWKGKRDAFLAATAGPAPGSSPAMP